MLLKQYLSVVLLALSGLLITLVSAFFSIKGFVMFIPDPELYIGLLGLGIAFEIAKITASTFLFHKMGDKQFPVLFKFIMTFSVVSLVIFSAIFTFVHLNASASKSLANTTQGNTEIVQYEDRNKVINERIKAIGDELASLPENMPSAKIKIYNTLNPEREKLQEELSGNMVKLNELRKTNVESDQFIFLSNLTKFTGIPQDKIFFIVTAFIVCVIDPLAISLFLCASYILAQSRTEEPVIESKLDSNEEYTHTPIDNTDLNELLIKATKSFREDIEALKVEVLKPYKESNERVYTLLKDFLDGVKHINYTYLSKEDALNYLSKAIEEFLANTPNIDKEPSLPEIIDDVAYNEEDFIKSIELQKKEFLSSKDQLEARLVELENGLIEELDFSEVYNAPSNHYYEVKEAYITLRNSSEAIKTALDKLYSEEPIPLNIFPSNENNLTEDKVQSMLGHKTLKVK